MRHSIICDLESSNSWVLALLWGDSRGDKDVVEVKLCLSVVKIKYVVARVVTKVCKVVVAHHFYDDLLMEVTGDLEVALSELVVPHLLAVVARASIDVTRQDKLATFSLAFRKLLLKPIKLLSSFLRLEASVIVVVHVLIFKQQDRDSVREICPVVAC